MIAKLKHLSGISTLHPAFVVGSGRSGTHWLGYSLVDHPEVRVMIEARPMYRLSKKMALNPNLERRMLGRLVLAYRWQMLKSAPRILVDKTHTNIWIAEKLKEAFPRSRFLGIERSPYATIASMMEHDGVGKWHTRWREFPIPNRFLGITADQEDSYDDLSFPTQCAMRWVAHHERMRELKTVLREDLFLISYELFARKTENVIRELQNFLRLGAPIPVPEVKTTSLEKWKVRLSDADIQQIEGVVGFPPDAVPLPGSRHSHSATNLHGGRVPPGGRAATR